MKYIGLIAGLGLAVFAGMQAQTVKAADTDYNVNVTGGGINLTQTPPDITFPSISVSNLATASDLLTATSDPGKIRVEDFRGTGTGWTLSATVSALKAGEHELANSNIEFSGANDPQATLMSNPDSATVSETSPIYSPQALTTGQLTPIWTATASEPGMGVNQVSLTSINLSLIAQNNVFAGDYHGTITWTLDPTVAEPAGDSNS